MSVDIEARVIDGRFCAAFVDIEASAAHRQLRAAARAEDAASDRVEELIEAIVVDGSPTSLSGDQIDELIVALETVKQTGAEFGRAMEAFVAAKKGSDG